MGHAFLRLALPCDRGPVVDPEVGFAGGGVDWGSGLLGCCSGSLERVFGGCSDVHGVQRLRPSSSSRWRKDEPQTRQ